MNFFDKDVEIKWSTFIFFLAMISTWGVYVGLALIVISLIVRLSGY